MGAVTSKVGPDFPPMGRQLKIHGAAEVEATIGESGAVEHVKPVSGTPVLTKTASEALLKWKFKPFTEDGKPIKVTATFSFKFSL
jgi:TonB family protein